MRMVKWNRRFAFIYEDFDASLKQVARLLSAQWHRMEMLFLEKKVYETRSNERETQFDGKCTICLRNYGL